MSIAAQDRPPTVANALDRAQARMDAIFTALRADGRHQDAGSLLKAGRLRTRLEAAQAIALTGDVDEAAALAADLQVAITAAFPATAGEDAGRDGEDNHLRFEAIGRSYLDGRQP